MYKNIRVHFHERVCVAFLHIIHSSPSCSLPNRKILKKVCPWIFFKLNSNIFFCVVCLRMEKFIIDSEEYRRMPIFSFIIFLSFGCMNTENIFQHPKYKWTDNVIPTYILYTICALKCTTYISVPMVLFCWWIGIRLERRKC